MEKSSILQEHVMSHLDLFLESNAPKTAAVSFCKVVNFFLISIQVIRGWNEGISQMSLGQRAKLTCEPDYAFKDHGYSGVSNLLRFQNFLEIFFQVIPPRATLVFDITLLGIEPGAQKLY